MYLQVQPCLALGTNVITNQTQANQHSDVPPSDSPNQYNSVPQILTTEIILPTLASVDPYEGFTTRAPPSDT